MSDLRIQETIDRINSINLNNITQTTPISDIKYTSYNGLSSDDICSLTSTSIDALTTDTIPALTINQLSAIGGISPTYTLTGTTAGNFTWQHPNVWTATGTSSATGTPMTVGQSGQLDLRGENADITINGKSMSNWMARVEERLNLLTPNPELEKDWDDLRKLGERYRKLEQKCKEKAETWKKLKAMPPPSLD